MSILKNLIQVIIAIIWHIFQCDLSTDTGSGWISEYYANFPSTLFIVSISILTAKKIYKNTPGEKMFKFFLTTAQILILTSISLRYFWIPLEYRILVLNGEITAYLCSLKFSKKPAMAWIISIFERKESRQFQVGNILINSQYVHTSTNTCAHLPRFSTKIKRTFIFFGLMS